MEKEIISQFLYNEKLKFSDIEKSMKIRSNKLAYYIKNMLKEGVLSKEGVFYRLSKNSENIIPYVTKKQAILPVILILLEDKGKIFLHQRRKRPYNDKLGLPGGRIILGENIKEATERIMKEKFNIKCNFKKINSLHLEHVRKENKIIHSFLLILVTATTKEKINFIDVLKNKNQIIKSDYFLIKNNFNSEIKVGNIKSII